MLKNKGPRSKRPTEIKMDKARITLSIESQDGLDGNVNTLKLKGLKHLLNHLLSVAFGIHRGLC